jgi:acetyl-CoA synthetase
MSDEFIRTRDFLLAHREDYEAAFRDFTWPRPQQFNWALDYFDRYAEGNRRTALCIADNDGAIRLSFEELRERSNRLANYLRGLGAQRGDRLLLMLPNSVPIWEIMLAAIKLGVVVTPTSTALTRDELADRFARGGIRIVVTDCAGADKLDGQPGDFVRLARWRDGRRLARLRGRLRHLGQLRLRRPDARLGSASTLFHLRDDRPTQAGHAHPPSYPIGHLTSVYVLGPQGRRCAPQRCRAGLGQTCLEQLLCPMERRGHGVRPQLRSL